MYEYVFAWWMPNRSEPINFTNYTDGQLTPNFTLYAVDDIFKFAAFSSSFSGYVIQFSSHLISSHLIANRLPLWLSTSTLWSLLMSSLVFNASTQQVQNVYISFTLLFNIVRKPKEKKQNQHKNENFLKEVEKKRNSKNNSFWCCNILCYYDASSIRIWFWFTFFFSPIYIHLICLAVCRLLNR